jgi:hypothetical protein
LDEEEEEKVGPGLECNIYSVVISSRLEMFQVAGIKAVAGYKVGDSREDEMGFSLLQQL